MPAVPIIVAAAVGSGAAAALGAAVVGTITAATISTAVATAVGVGVISGVSTAVQGGSSSDILKSAVVGGVSSYVGGQVASKVTSAVASQTGASLVDLEPSLRALSGEGVTAAGIASITAGNVAGAATSAAITGQPIDQAALFGLAQSIPTALSGSQDFRSLNPVVQNVLASSAQAAVMGQDVGDAAIASLVASSGIVARAINEVPGGQEFIQNNPIYAKYVIDSVSSALAAQLQGKDVGESVLFSLARTTADVLKNEFSNNEKRKAVEDSQSTYQQALSEEQKLNDLIKRRNELAEDPKYEYAIGSVNGAADQITQIANGMNDAVQWINYYANFYNASTNEQERASLLSLYQNYQNTYDNLAKDYKSAEKNYSQKVNNLTRSGFYNEQTSLDNQINESRSLLDGYTRQLDNLSENLFITSNNLFTDFETEIATNISPLTAFEDVTDVGDQDVLAEIQPVAPPSPEIGIEVAGPVSPDILGRLQSMPLFGETVYKETETPRPDSISGTMNMRFVEGFRTDGTPYYYAIATFENGDVRYVAYQDGEPTIFDNRPDLKTSGAGVGDVAVDAEVSGEGQGAAGAGIGTPGAPAVDLGQAAPVEVVDPEFSVGFDLRDFGPGSPLSPNLALFEIGGGRGTPGGSSTETTFNLVSRDQGTGQETYDVGGKQYALVVLPDKQVLVPQKPSEVVVYLERDPVTKLPKMKEVPVSIIPPQDAQQISEKIGQAASGAPTGAEGAAGGRTAQEDRVATTEEQLQPGARPEEVAAAPSFPEFVSGITEPTVPAPVPGEDAGFEEALQAPGGGGAGVIGDVTDDDIIRLIEEELGTPGGGGGGGAPGEEGAGVGEGEEGEGEGAGKEGEGQGAGGDGTGLGLGNDGVGSGTGDRGDGTGAGGQGSGTGIGTGEGTKRTQPTSEEEKDITLPTPVITTVDKRLPPQFLIRSLGSPYRVTGQDESGILGRKQPLFGGDEDLQRAEWNRRSLRLKRLLGL